MSSDKGVMDTNLMTKLVEAQLQAYNARDLDAFCRCYHKDIVVMNLLSRKVTCEGLGAFKEIYRKLFESPGLKCTIKSRIVLDEAVIDEEWVLGIPRFPNGLHVVAIYGFRDELIDRVWFPRN